MKFFRLGRTQVLPIAAETLVEDGAAETAAAERAAAEAADRERLTRLARHAAHLGHDIVEVAGFLDQVDRQSRDQTELLCHITDGLHSIEAANRAATEAAFSVSTATARTRAIIGTSVEFVRASGRKSQAVAGWVAELGGQIEEVLSALSAADHTIGQISGIAHEVNMLAVNAKIEASRVGDAGRGFAVIAMSISELSQSTARAADSISASIETLRKTLTKLADRADRVSAEACQVIGEAAETDGALTQIAEQICDLEGHAAAIRDESDRVRTATDAFLPDIRAIESSVRGTAEGISTVHKRADALIDGSEAMVQLGVMLGGGTEDQPYIERVQADAAELGARLSAAVANGRISLADLFVDRYEPIRGTNPQQVMAPFTRLTDEIFPEVQEAALAFSSAIVFCAAVDRNGYLPTHNRKFSRPQGADVVWNTANCRNRRIFDDRVGLKAGRNSLTFLLQVYRRDMGGGEFRMMKDVSAPIFVGGRHWGGLRLAYTF